MNAHSAMRKASRDLVLALSVVALVAWNAMPTLSKAWGDDLFARGGAVAFGVWLAAPGILFFKRYRLAVSPSLGWLGVSLVLSAAGAMSELRVLQHLALACAVPGLLGTWWVPLAALAAAPAWLPATGWFLSHWISGGLAGWERPTFGFAMALFLLALGHFFHPVFSQRRAGPMKQRAFGCLVVVAVILMFGWPMIPVPSAETRVAALPTSGPDFQSRSLELTADDRAFLGKAQAHQSLISLRGGGRLVLNVIDGTRNRHSVHDPSYCFSSAGWSVRSKTPVKVSSGDAILVTLTKDSEQAEALWFFDDGKHQFISPIEYWFATSCRRATLGRSGNEPVLVSLRSYPGEPVDWDRVRHILLPALGFR